MLNLTAYLACLRSVCGTWSGNYNIGRRQCTHMFIVGWKREIEKIFGVHSKWLISAILTSNLTVRTLAFSIGVDIFRVERLWRGAWLILLRAVIVVGLVIARTWLWLVEFAIVGPVRPRFKIIVTPPFTLTGKFFFGVLLRVWIVSFLGILAWGIVIPFSITWISFLRLLIILIDVVPLMFWSRLIICCRSICFHLLLCVVVLGTCDGDFCNWDRSDWVHYPNNTSSGVKLGGLQLGGSWVSWVSEGFLLLERRKIDVYSRVGVVLHLRILN
jgi:hypothetical protein